MTTILNKLFHRYSGILIAFFTGLHLINHLLSWGGASLHIRFMDLLRLVYRNPVVELILLVCVLYQVLSGVKLATGKIKLKGKNNYECWQIISGLYLAFFLCMHVAAVMFFRCQKGVDTNYYFIVEGFTSMPELLFFIPYYTLAILMLFTHVACIHYLKMSYYIQPKQAAKQAMVILGIGCLCCLGIILGYSGLF